MTSSCLLSLEEVRGAFLGAPVALRKEIRDLTVNSPSFLEDLVQYDNWDLGQGAIQTEIDFIGELPAIERDFSKWGKVSNTNGCDPCEPPSCGYNITKLQGHAFQQKIIQLMSRELVSPSFCIKEIQTTAHYKQVFAKIVENLQRQVRWMKEINVTFNFLTQLAKKFVVDSEGVKGNKENPYVYRNIGTARISNLNPYVLEWFYEWMTKMSSVQPLAIQDGVPMYGLLASKQLLSRMYRDNPTLRQDIRFSSLANDLISKYNFVSNIQGQFIPATMMWPRRFNVVAGEPVEVLPFVNGIPANYGTYTGFNPAYEDATHEEIIIFGKAPLKVYVMPSETDLGENATFGPEPSYFENWQWINPQTPEDFFRREGWYASAATIGLSSQNSEGIFGWLVERPRNNALATFFPDGDCPPVSSVCDNTVPAVSCPCPLVISVTADAFNANNYVVTFSAPVVASVNDAIQLATDTGGYVAGVVQAITTDGYTLRISVSSTLGVNLSTCNIVGVFCDNTLGCSADVLGYNLSCTDNTRLGLNISNPIKGGTGSVLVYFGNGQTATVTIISQDMLANILVIDVGSTAFCDQVGGIVKVCVPPTTDATCPACGTGPVVTQCS